jgi:hypothetical protein
MLTYAGLVFTLLLRCAEKPTLNLHIGLLAYLLTSTKVQMLTLLHIAYIHYCT